MALPIPDAAPVTNAMRPWWVFGFGIRCSLASSSAQYSMRNFSASEIGRVGRERLGAAHHVDRVEVELAGDAGGLLVRAVAEHADAGHEHDERVGAADRGGVLHGVLLVVRGVVGAVGLVQLLQSRELLLDRGVRGQVEQHRLDLGAQEVVGAAGAQRGELRSVRRREELEHAGVVGEVADHGLVVRGEAADRGRQSRGLSPALGIRKRAELLALLAEGLLLAVRVDVRLGGLDDPERVRLGLLRRVAPRGDAVPAEDAADRVGVRCLDRGDVEPELEAGATPRHPDDLAAEDLLRELRAVLGRRDRDARVGMQVVDVRGIHEAVHRGVDRRGCAALAVQAVVERGDHLVLAVEARVDVDERAHAVQAQHREARLGEGAEVAAGALHPQQLDRLTGHRVGLGALGGRVAAGVVRVLRVGPEAIGARDQIGGSGVRHERDPSVGSGAEVRVDASALESTDSGATGVWRGFESGGRAARRAAMRSRDAANAASSGRFRWPCRVPGSVSDVDVAAGVGESAGEVLARDAEFVDLAVDHECRREVREVFGSRQPRNRGERRPVDRAAEVVLVHSAHGVGSEGVGLGVGVERGAQIGIRCGLHGEQRRVGEHDECGVQADVGEQAQRGSGRQVGAGARTAERPRPGAELGLDGPAERGDDVIGCRRVVHAVLGDQTELISEGLRQRREPVVDRHHRDAARREGAGDPVGLGHVEVAAGEPAAVRPDQTRAVRDHAGRGRRRVHPHEPAGCGVGIGHRAQAPQPAWTPPTRSASIFCW